MIKAMAKRKSNRTALLKKRISLSWHRALNRLIPMGGISSGNILKIFHNGDEAFLAIHTALSAAQKSIYLETYIFAPDRVGFWIRDALIAAAKRGVMVTVLFDHLGSSALTEAFLTPMKHVGIKVLDFNPIWPWRRRGPLLFRDHRKIIVIDGKKAFCGGMNISDDYAGPLYGNDRFRDSMAQVEGPAVSDLLDITLESIVESEFAKAESELPAIRLDGQPVIGLILRRLIGPKELLSDKFATDTMVQVLRSNSRKNLTHIQKSMEECIDRAVSYCYFTTPYFLPYDSLRRSIINAAKRGVDVRILTAGLSDIPFMHYASRHVYSSFLAHGVRIYEMDKKTLHAKLACVDGVYASIGSYNLDHWSARRNLEVNMSILDPHVAAELKEQFYRDLELSHEIEAKKFQARSIIRRFMCWLSYLFLRL